MSVTSERKRAMRPARLLVLAAAFSSLPLGSLSARAVTVTYSLIGAEVAVSFPDWINYGEAFDVSFSVDVSTMAPGNTLAFKTYLDTTDTIDLSGSTWEYTFSSDEPAWNFTLFGTPGDATMPMSHDASGYSLRLYDPINGEYTWLWSSFNDRVEWTLRNVILNQDSLFSLTLELFMTAPETFITAVPQNVLPEPSPRALAALVLAGLALSARRRPTARRR
jgi:hypothetical protein